MLQCCIACSVPIYRPPKVMKNLKNIRLQKYNYSDNGYYFVTAVCDNRKDVFFGREDIVAHELQDLVFRTNGVDIDYFVIMPNHVHIIFVLQNSSLGLGEIVRRFKAKVARRLEEKVWQPNYYEHVIRNEGALLKIREYIQNNPQALLLKFDKFYQ